MISLKYFDATANVTAREIVNISSEPVVLEMLKILIVEDEPRIVAFVEKGLQKQGYQTTVATDGEEAIQLVQQQQFDLVLLDLGLPIKDGWAVLRVLKELRQVSGQNVPEVIILTARSDDNDRQASLQLGARDYLTKPFRFNDLLQRVNGVLKTHLPVGAVLALTSLLY
jgi:two-component system, OmpR family, copper resistance phosphate regulon response regulator CusR